jgi:hypothetical protein
MAGIRRGAAAGAAAVAVVAVLGAPSAQATPTPVPAPAPGPAWASAATAAIRPGVLTTTDGGGSCTADFVFTAGGRTFLGQAAHCGGTGGETETNGCTSATVPLGTPVTIAGADGRTRTGTLAYSSWASMQRSGETDPDTCAYNDFALVALDPADVAAVNPSVPFFGGPTGIDTDGLAPGDPVYTYGNSPLRLGVATLRPKVGTTAGESGGGRGHEIYTVTPGIPGDSGSAFLSGNGAALGVLSTLNLAPLPVSNGVADLARALDYANADGGLGDVELVLGTEPFDPAPAGIPVTELSAPAGPPLGG